jgi:hypothetical protein
MVEMFNKFQKNETNEHTALILMLGVLSEKLSEIISLLEKNNARLDFAKKEIEEIKQDSKKFSGKKLFEELSWSDYE